MITNDICNVKKKEFLALPQKPFTEVHVYDAIIVVPTTRKHDSGWRLMALIGCKKVGDKHNVPVHIIGYCDDINIVLDSADFKKYDRIRADMTISNCLRFWSNEFDFEVGIAVSSTDITIIPTQNPLNK